MPDRQDAPRAERAEAMPVSCLVVDDNPFDRRMVKRCFGREKPEMRLWEADSIASARAILAQVRPDVILLDHRLPDGQGAAFAAELQSDSRQRGAVICVVTSADPRLLDPAVTALSKDTLTPRSLWELLDRFLIDRDIDRETEAAQLVCDFGAEMQADLGPAVSRMLRTLRSAKTRSRLTAPRAAMDDLEKLEEMLLALSETLAVQRQ